LVNLDLHEDAVLRCRVHQRAVLLQRLDRGLGDDDVHTTLDAGHRDLEVGVVRRKDNRTVARREGPEGQRPSQPDGRGWVEIQHCRATVEPAADADALLNELRSMTPSPGNV
jgi:hypothetical protein